MHYLASVPCLLPACNCCVSTLSGSLFRSYHGRDGKGFQRSDCYIRDISFDASDGETECSSHCSAGAGDNLVVKAFSALAVYKSPFRLQLVIADTQGLSIVLTGLSTLSISLLGRNVHAYNRLCSLAQSIAKKNSISKLFFLSASTNFLWVSYLYQLIPSGFSIMPLLATENLLIPTKDLISWCFDNRHAFNQDKPVHTFPV
jgi:hypothetical protein